MGNLADMLVAGGLTSVAATLLCCKIGIKRILGYHIAADIAFTVAFVFIFSGTYSGVVAGAFAGLCLTVQLMALRPLLGYTVLKYDREMGFLWVSYPPYKFKVGDKMARAYKELKA